MEVYVVTKATKEGGDNVESGVGKKTKTESLAAGKSPAVRLGDTLSVSLRYLEV